MHFIETPLKGSYLINQEPREDERGFFARLFCEKEFALRHLNTHWAQANNSFCKSPGILRGLHFQYPPDAEVKLVRCVRGSIWDVILDIRPNSGTYGQWFGHELSAENRTMMYVPEGFAHGFISLSDESEILYLVSSCYSMESEGIVRWDDPFHNIRWPIPPTIISEKDRNATDWTGYAPAKSTKWPESGL